MRRTAAIPILVLASWAVAQAQEPDRPQTASDYLCRGDKRLSSGDLDGAIDDFTEAIRLSPGDGAGHRGRGRARYRKGDLQGAIGDLTEAIRLNPLDVRALRLRGDAHGDNRDFKAAVAAYNEVLRLDPTDQIAWLNRGQARLELGELEAALADTNEAIRLDSEDSMARNNRGYLRLLQGDVEGARQDFRRATELKPEAPVPCMNLAALDFDEGKYAEALEAVLPILRASVPGEDRDYVALFAMLCRLRLQERELFTPEIKAVFEGRDPRAKDDWPSAIAAYLRGDVTGEELLKMGASAAGPKALERECEGWFYVAAVCWTQGKTGKAIEACEKCLATKMYAFHEYVRARTLLARLRENK